MEDTLTKIKAIIIDDEFHGRENLKNLIETYCPEVEVCGTADSAVNGKKLVDIHKPDAVFLDINMPLLDGFDFLSEYDEHSFMPVFVSAHEDFGIKAVKAGAVDYLLKPVSIKELKECVKKLVRLNSKKSKDAAFFEKDKLIIPSSHGFNVLMINDILRLEAEGSYTKVITVNNKSVIVSRTLKDFEDAIPAENFFRIHKSHLINIKYIKEYSNIDGSFVIMTDGSKIEISRRKAPEFLQKVKSAMNVV